MTATMFDARSGAARPRMQIHARPDRIGIAHGSLPPASVIFEQKNSRRLQLLEMEFAGTLSNAEETELTRLQRETAGIMAYLHPLPTKMLDQLEALATRLETQSGQHKP